MHDSKFGSSESPFEMQYPIEKFRLCSKEIIMSGDKKPSLNKTVQNPMGGG